MAESAKEDESEEIAQTPGQALRRVPPPASNGFPPLGFLSANFGVRV
jgi:hypothetical protein